MLYDSCFLQTSVSVCQTQRGINRIYIDKSSLFDCFEVQLQTRKIILGMAFCLCSNEIFLWCDVQRDTETWSERERPGRTRELLAFVFHILLQTHKERQGERERERDTERETQREGGGSDNERERER